MSRDDSAWARESALTVSIGLTTWQSVSNVRKNPKNTVVRTVKTLLGAGVARSADALALGREGELDVARFVSLPPPPRHVAMGCRRSSSVPRLCHPCYSRFVSSSGAQIPDGQTSVAMKIGKKMVGKKMKTWDGDSALHLPAIHLLTILFSFCRVAAERSEAALGYTSRGRNWHICRC